MSNMSYCRFRNTLGDLRDCEEAMDDNLDDSPDEMRARRYLIGLCVDIATSYGHEIDRDCEEV